MGNKLSTEFKFIDTDANKIDALRGKLVDFNNYVNNLGKNADFGKRIENESVKGTAAVGKLGKEVDTLKTKTETFQARPTISRYYENEAAEVKKSVNSIKREIDSLNTAAPRTNPGKLSLDRIASGIGDDGVSRARPKINIDYGESRFNTPAPFDKSVKTPGGGNLKLSSFQKTNLSYQINDVLTGLASGQNPAQILAQQGGQIAQIFSKEQIAGFTAAYGGLVSILGLGTVAIAATYKITGDLRAEAERRLKVEETIAGTINRQILGQQEALRVAKEQQITAEKNFYFQRDLKTDSKEQLESRLATAQLLLNNTLPTIKTYDGSGKLTEKTNEEFTRRAAEVADFKARLRELPYEKNDRLARAFDQHNEDFKRSRQNDREFEKQSAEKRKQEAEKRKQELEQIQEKVRDLGKTYTNIYDNLLQKTNANNPFVTIFSEGDKAIRDLRENLKGLAPELQTVVLQMQQKLNSDSLFNARLENDFARFDLRERADELRSFKTPKIEDPNKFFNDFVADGLKQAVAANGGSNIRYNSNIFTDKDGKKFTTGFTQTDLRDEINTVFERTGGGGFFRRQKSFADLTNREKDEFINRDNLSAQAKLDRAFSLAGNRTTLNDDQQATIDRKIIALSAGLRPEQLTAQQRDLAATANEKEAARRATAEQAAVQRDIARNGYLEQIAANGKRLMEIAEKEGFKGLERILRVVTEPGVSAELQPAATSKDTAQNYE